MLIGDRPNGSVNQNLSEESSRYDTLLPFGVTIQHERVPLASRASRFDSGIRTKISSIRKACRASSRWFVAYDTSYFRPA